MAHIHILGICGTFMAGVAALAKAQGHTVTGCDQAVYPPMSDQLKALGISLIEGYTPDQIALKPDYFVIGNVVKRGNPLMEAILNQDLPYISGPQWLSENILRGKHVMAVAGTHGKTTTSSMLAWILEANGKKPGFLIGGIPENFNISARLTDSPYFVIEADEYDTAFFDKRSKFVHYHPRTAILNNLEFDHADIFDNLQAIETQFHFLMRTIPSEGQVIVNADQPALKRVLDRGCWSKAVWFGKHEGWLSPNPAHLPEGITLPVPQNGTTIDEQLVIIMPEGQCVSASWELMGDHNRSNAAASVAAAYEIGISPNEAVNAMSTFKGVKRRLEIRGEIKGRTVYDDFAHHPTAIETTLAGLRRHVGKARIIALFEPRSNTMKRGVMRDALPPSFKNADFVYCYDNGVLWDAETLFRESGLPSETVHDLTKLAEKVVNQSKRGDHIVVMSNGGFGGVINQILERLDKLEETA